MTNLNGGFFIDASYQDSVHLAERFQRRRFKKKSSNQKQELPVAAIFVNGSRQNEQSLQMTFNRCCMPSFDSFGRAVSEEKIVQRSTNQKHELPMAAMFVIGSERNKQSLLKTFHRCFLLSFGSLGYVVSEEKIFQKSTNQKQKLPVAAMFVNISRQNEQSKQRTFHRCFQLSFGPFIQTVSEVKTFKNRPIRNKNCLWRPCLLTDRN